MNKNLTEIVYILDRSGSMAHLQSDTVGGYNSFIEKQKNGEGDAVITTVLFDDKYEILCDRADVKKVPPLTENEYYARGMTALYDAVGTTVAHVKARHESSLDSEVPARTIVVITTDGMENASREYGYVAVKAMIEKQKEKGWEFLFLGANIDAVKTAATMGIAPGRSATYKADSFGTAINFNAVSGAISTMRCSCPCPDNWKEDVESYADGKNEKKKGFFRNK